MNNLVEIIKSQLSGELFNQLNQQTEGDTEQTQNAAEVTITTLLAALQKNAKDPQGAKSLNSALERDHDGSELSNLASAIFGNSTPQNSKAVDGAGIIQHIFGSNTNNTITMLSKLTGMGETSTGKMLISLAPLVMGALGKQKKSQNVGASGLSDLLSAALDSTGGSSKNPKLDLITRFLDSDGDGSIVDEITQIGSSIIGSFFSKK